MSRQQQQYFTEPTLWNNAKEMSHYLGKRAKRINDIVPITFFPMPTRVSIYQSCLVSAPWEKNVDPKDDIILTTSKTAGPLDYVHQSKITIISTLCLNINKLKVVLSSNLSSSDGIRFCTVLPKWTPRLNNMTYIN